jgi:hypothetical protein
MYPTLSSICPMAVTADALSDLQFALELGQQVSGDSTIARP